MSKKIDYNSYWQIDENPISRTGIFPYLGRQISPLLEPNKVYDVLRPEEELFSQETMNSFKLKPLVNDHCMLGEDFTPAEKHGIHGVLGERIRRKGDFLVANMEIYSETIKNEIRNGKKELSLGYFCDYDLTPGTYRGRHYDAVQRNLRGNHIALVDKGRMGHDVRVMDGVQANDAKNVLVYDEMPFVEDMVAIHIDDDNIESQYENVQPLPNEKTTEDGHSKKGNWIYLHPNGKRHKGNPVELDKNNRIIAGLGGQHNGQTIGELNKTEHYRPNRKFIKERQRRLLKALEGLKENEEVIVRHVRDDLTKYANTNDLILKYGEADENGDGFGLKHIIKKHGKDAFAGIVNAIIEGDIIEHHQQGKRLIIVHKGYKVILSLDDNGKKKVWLLSGYKIDPQKQKNKNTQDEISEISTQSDPTQCGPTFWRPTLVACVIDSLTKYFNDFNSGETEKAAAKEKGMKDEKENKNPPEAADPGEEKKARPEEKSTEDKKSCDGGKSARIAEILKGKTDEQTIAAVMEALGQPDDAEEAGDGDDQKAEGKKEKEPEAKDKKPEGKEEGKTAKKEASAEDAALSDSVFDRLEAEIASRIAARDALVSRLKPIIGEFKGEAMTKRQVIEYACDALSLTEKTEKALTACLDRKETEGTAYVKGGASNHSVIERFLKGE